MKTLSELLPIYGGGFWVALLQNSLVYYVTAALLHFVVPKVIRVKSIQVGQRRTNQVLEEALNCLGPLIVRSAGFVVVENMYANGISKLYMEPISSLSQVPYLLATVIALDYIHDAWFYWTHRFLHWRPVYKHVHAMHHRSTVPTAFAGYSFHVLEAVLVYMNQVIECFFFPIHAKVHRLYHLYSILIHVGGHAGYEIAPFIPSVEQLLLIPFNGLKLAHGLNTVQHHDIHHRFPTKHFSLYFTHWDRWMGTQHEKYEKGLFSYF